MGLRLQGALLLAALLVAGAVAAAGGSAAPQAAPTNTGEPAISGTPVVGNTLTASRGTWSGSPTSFAYQWVRCPASGGKSDGSDCAAIGGATTSAYVPTSADVDRRLRIRVTASNADGSATAASNATTAVRPRTSGAPRSTSRPTIGGTMAVDQTVHATTGGWVGTQPITFSFQWLRCNAEGNNCVTLPGATDDAYTLREGDAGHAMRVRVTARNDDGTNSSLSLPSSVVQAAAGPSGAVKLPNGEVSIPATSVPPNVRLVVDRVDFSPNPVRSRSTAIKIVVKIKDTRGFVVRDTLVFIRSTPVVTNTPPETKTGQDGTITFTVQPESDFLIKPGYSTQFFVRARKEGDKPLGGIAGYRLVQVASTG